MVTVALNALSDWRRAKWNRNAVSVGGWVGGGDGGAGGWRGEGGSLISVLITWVLSQTHTHTHTPLAVSLSHADTLTDSHVVSPTESIGTLVTSSLPFSPGLVVRCARTSI